MKKILIAALAATSALAATPASAQTAVSGTVTVTGTVALKCTANPNNLDGSITLGELALANGTVDSAFSSNSGGLTRTYTVTCTGPNATLSAEANALVNSAIVSPTAGYTNTVHYTATLTADKAGSGSASAVDLSSAAGATAVPLGGHLANAAGNVRLTISAGNTTNATDLLEAGSYSGSVAISVTPTV